MIVHMSLNMLAPGLLVLGGVITLLLRAARPDRGKPAGPHDWVTWALHWPVLRVVYNPLIVFVVFVGSYYGLYLTGIFGDYMRFHWAHQLMNVHFLIVGYLYYSLIIGVDRPPRPLPHIGKLGYVLAAMPFHAFFGVILMTSPDDHRRELLPLSRPALGRPASPAVPGRWGRVGRWGGPADDRHRRPRHPMEPPGHPRSTPKRPSPRHRPR